MRIVLVLLIFTSFVSVQANGLKEHINYKYLNIIGTENYELMDVAIFEKDDRQKAKGKESGSVWCYKNKEDRKAWKFVGYGSATIIDPSSLGIKTGDVGDIVTSAEHVMVNEHTGYEYICDFWPKHNWRKRVKISNVLYGNFHKTGDREDDWSVATIPKLSDKEGYRALGIALDLSDVNLKDNFSVFFQGYDKDNDRISFSDRCMAYTKGESTFLKHNLILGTDCDAAKGASGGYLGVYHNDEKLVVGIYWGGYFNTTVYPDGVAVEFKKGKTIGIEKDFNLTIGSVIKYEDHKELLEAIKSRALLTH